MIRSQTPLTLINEGTQASGRRVCCQTKAIVYTNMFKMFKFMSICKSPVGDPVVQGWFLLTEEWKYVPKILKNKTQDDFFVNKSLLDSLRNVEWLSNYAHLTFYRY